MLVKRNCKYCNEEYDADTRYLKRNQGYFCSLKCSGLYHGTQVEKPKPNTVCAYCKTPIYKPPAKFSKSKSGLVFCNRKCQGLGFSSTDVPVKSGPAPYSTERSECDRDGCHTQTKNSTCARCLKQDKISQWLSGDISVTWMMPRKDPKTFVKQYLIDTRGDRCEVCGFDEKHPIDGRSVITMDHIDGDYTNNHIDNLKLLCPNHHALTPTYGSRNKGNGRSYRKQYYSSTI